MLAALLTPFFFLAACNTQLNTPVSTANPAVMEKDATDTVCQTVDTCRKAAEQGNAKAQSRLGRMYATGEGVTSNFPQAVFWFRKAAQQGNALALYDLIIVRDATPRKC